MDQPKHGLDMITRFTRGEPLATAAASSRSHGRVPRQPAKLLPGAMWQLRRAMPDRQASLTADAQE